MTLRTRVILKLALLAALIGGVIGWPVGSHYYAKAKLEHYLNSLGAHGERLLISDTAPKISSADLEASTSLMVTAAFLPSISSNFPPLMKYVSPGKAQAGWQQPILSNADVKNVWVELKEPLAANAENTSDLRALLLNHSPNFNLNYDQGFNLLLPHLTRMKLIAQWLSANTVYDLHAGQVDPALQNLEALEALAEKGCREPLVICELVRIAVGAIAMATTWEVLQSPDLKEKDLVRIQMCWQRVDFLSQAENALAMERAMAARTYVQGRKSYTFIAKGGFTTTPPSTGLAELTQLGKDVLDNPKDGLASIAHRYPGYWHWRWWQSYEDELANAEIIQANLDGIRQARGGQALGPLSKQIIESSEQIHNRHPSAGRWLGFTMADVMGHFTARIARLEMQRTLLVTAVGLKRYQLVYGHYPEHLAEMVPQFLDSQPLDPMDGKWLRYHLCEDGLYLLYSTGEDAVDSGGDGTPSQQGQRQWLRGRDAVWPFAASKDEIEAENRRIEAEQKAKGSGPNAEFRRRYGLDSTAPPPVAGTNASPK